MNLIAKKLYAITLVWITIIMLCVGLAFSIVLIVSNIPLDTTTKTPRPFQV